MTRRTVAWILLATLVLTLAGIGKLVPGAFAAGGLLGDTAVEPSTDQDAGGTAEAYQVAATATGSVSSLSIYVDASSTATTVVAGVYTDNAGHPGTLLTQGSQANPSPGAWNTLAATPAITVTAGTTYWLALLGAAGSGNIAFHDRCCGGGSLTEGSAQTTLTSLPASWSSGAAFHDGPISLYAGTATPPTPTPSPGPPSQLGQWSSVISWPLVSIHSVLMRNGNVLVMDGDQIPNQTQVFNPTTQALTPAINGLGLDLFCSAHVNLPDGRVLVVGGEGTTQQGSSTVTAFDPSTNTWSRLPSMQFPRWYPTATELGDGRVLVISGQDTATSWVTTPEIYDPAKNTWTALSGISTSQVQEPEYPLTYLLPSGKTVTIAPVIGQAFLLDPSAQTWVPVQGNTLQNGSAVMYLPGKILYTGGGAPFGSTNASVTSAQSIDLNSATPTWQAAAPMHDGRYAHTLTVLPDGKVLAVGGTSNLIQTDLSVGVLSSEEWSPTTNTWTTLAPMAVPRIYHSTALLLPDGRVLVSGGGHGESLSSPAEYNAQFYSPPYLFQGSRPTITSAPGSATYGTPMTVQTPDAASIASVALVSFGSDSHTLDFDQHFVPLSFTASNGALTVSMPASANLAPPGTYMLFLVNSQGVPSVASIVQVGATADTTPPTVSLTAPTNGASVSGTVQLNADAKDDVAVASVQFKVDGAPVGAPVTQAPYTTSWDSTTVANGSHTITAIATDIAGNSATSTITVTVNNAPGGTPVPVLPKPPVVNPTPSAGQPLVESASFKAGIGPVSSAIHTSAAGELLIARVRSDAPSAPNSPPQTITLTSPGLSWQLVKRTATAAAPGDVEIWVAHVPAPLMKSTVTAVQSSPGLYESLAVVAIQGAAGVGATQSNDGTATAPTVTLTTTRPGSLIIGIGEDVTAALTVSAGKNQAIIGQAQDMTANHTVWAQRTVGPAIPAGAPVTLDDILPLTDSWNLSGVEITGS